MHMTRMLKGLLAIIHRDGGHYTEEHGLEKSYEDAIQIVANQRGALMEAGLLVDVVPPAAPVPSPTRVPRLGLTCTNPCEAQMVRVPGDMICDSCTQPYRKHPYCRGHITMMTGEPEYYIHVSCSGRHLKL